MLARECHYLSGKITLSDSGPYNTVDHGFKMASRVVPDFPAVLVALEHINELDKELKEEGVSFSLEANFHLSETTAAVTGLEAERRAAHEHLEVATIENSMLRHQINNTRDQMSEVVMADVAAARASNAEEIAQLHKDLLAVSQLQETTVKKNEALVSQNEVLSLEREKVKLEHQGVIAALNQEITQKHALQMQLDQTRENIEELLSLIATFEQNTSTLQQCLASEKEAFAVCRDYLSQELDQNEKRIKDQEQEIMRSRKELKSLNENKRDASDRVDELRVQNIQLESSIQRFMASKSQCEKNLEAEKETHQQLKAQKEALTKEMDELIKAFNKTVKSLKEETAAIEERMVEATASRLRIQDTLAQVYEVFKMYDEEETEVRAEYDYVSAQLEKSKLQLEERIASIVRHKNEVNEMNQQIEDLREADRINKRVFERDQDELCGNMDVERQHMKAFEDEKMQLQKLLEETKRKQEEHVKKMTADIKGTWRKYKELQKEEATLKARQPLSYDALKSHIVESEVEYKRIESVCREEINQCSSETENVMVSCRERQKEAAEKEEILQEVEAKWKEKLSRHEELKKLETELKMKKYDLEQSIESLKEDTVSQLQPKEEMKAELERIRASHMKQLSKQASELKSAEMGLYDSGVKLEQVHVENSRLQLCIRQMTQDAARAREDKDRHRQETMQLKRDTKTLIKSIQEAWRDEMLLTQERHNIDAALMTPMNALQSHLKSRGQQLSHVQTLLHEQMLDFSRRLGDKITIEPQF